MIDTSRVHQLLEGGRGYRLRIGLSGWILGLAMLPVVSFAGSEANPPNIVVIMADDLGWRDVSYHDSEIQTPAIDRIAQAGIELDRFYVQPICSPTRAAVMAGKSPSRLGVVRPISKLDPSGLPISETILPQIFHRAGYQTLMAGKWHLGHVERQYFPSERGFEEFYGHVTGGIGYWDHNHGGGHDWQRNGQTVREEGYATRLIGDEAVRLLRHRDRTRPTFLFASFNAPHTPNEAPADTIEGLPESLAGNRRIHAAMVKELDRAVARILETLEEEGIQGNTIVWFLSDNGGLNADSFPPQVVEVVEDLRGWFGRPFPIEAMEFFAQQVEDGASDNSPLRGGKTSVYEGGVRVPSAIWWPGKTRPGMSNAFVTAQDVLPTLLQAVGLSKFIPDDLDGVARWAAILGDETPYPAYRVQGLNGAAVYQFPWKLVVVASPLPFQESEVELYNVYEDPSERSNIASQYPERVAEMTALEVAWPRGPEVHAPAYRVLMDPDRFGGPEDRQPWAEAAR